MPRRRGRRAPLGEMETLFGERLRRWGADARVAPALEMPGRAISYAELDARVDASAAWLVAQGCRPRAVVGVVIADEEANLVVTLALLRLGVPQICLPSYETAGVRARLAQRLDVARVVATDPLHAIDGRPFSHVAPDLPAPGAQRVERGALAADPDAAAIYVTSSGTTGDPKILPISQRVLAIRAEQGNLGPGERPLVLGSVEDFPGRSSRLRAIYLGLTSVLQAPGGAPRIGVQDLCTRLAVTRLDLTVLQATGLAPGRVPGASFRSGLKLFAWGSRVPRQLRDAYRAAGTPLYVDYGAREAGGFTSTYPVDRDPSFETVGPRLPGTEIQLVDDEGREVVRGEIGEIRVRTTMAIDGYFRDPAATARHFRDGWFHPGDLGAWTANGSLVLHGRADDRLNMNGIKIFPSEIEHVLESDSAVKAAAAFGVPSPMHGEIPYAAVELHDPSAADVAGLMARARERLGVRAPRRIMVVGALPRNASGKVVRRELVALATGAGATPTAAADE